MFSKKTTLFCDPAIIYPKLDPNLAFRDYINFCKHIIETTRLDLDAPNRETIINANAPFELRPEQTPKQGVLLIHGLFDSPFIMRDMGHHLQKLGLLVRSILLPGQGTIPGALLNVTYQQWLETVNYGIETLKKDVDEIFIAGFSTGASLAIYHTIKNPTAIKGLILLSPALKIRSAFDFMSNWYKIFLKCSKRAAWFYLDQEETIDYAKYRSVPFNAVYQVYRLAKAINTLQPSNYPSCPFYMCMSADDETIHSETSIQYFLKNNNPSNRFLLYTPRITRFNDSRLIEKNVVYPTQNIINFSHSCIPIAPTNAHYGPMGDYRYASRLIPGTVYGNFSPLNAKFNRLFLKLKLTHIQKARLTYNPDFDFFMQSIQNFIKPE